MPAPNFLDLDITHRAGPIARLELRDFTLVRIELVEVGEDRVAFHRAGDVGADAVRIGVHAVHPLAHRGRVVAEEDRVAQRLAHFGLAIGARQRVPFHEVVGHGKQLAVLVIEATRDLARDLDVRLVVLAHRHQMRLRQEDVGGLEHRIAQQPERDRLLVHQRGARHLLDARQPRQPRHGHEIAQEQRQLIRLMDRRLEEDRGDRRVDAGAQVVQHHAARVIGHLRDVLFAVLGGQHVQVGDDEIALVLMLQAHAVAQAAHVVPQVQAAGRPVAGENALFGGP